MIYYGYRRGDNDKTVDWSSVSSDITERLGEVEAKRAAQREKIEGEIAAAQQSINDIPMGNYEDINNFMLKFSNTAAEQMRVNNALLRSGQMKPSEYTPFRQNVMDAAVSYKKIAENYNGMMDEFTLRQQEGKAGELEAWQAGLVQQMADLSNTVPVIDPVSGKVFNAPIGADGRPDMKKAMAVRDMQNMAYQKYDRFDMNAQLDPIVEKYGKEIRVLRESGVLTKSDILQRKFGDKSMSDVIDETIKQYNPEQMASVLLDFDQGYKVTDDPSERDADPEKFILVGKDGRLANRLSPDLTEEQQAKARQIIKDQLLTKLDLVETPMAQTSDRETEAERKAGESRKLAVASINTLADWYGAKTPKDRSAAAAGLASSFGEDFLSLEPSADGKTATFRFIDRSGGKLRERSAEIRMDVPFDQFIKDFGKALTGQDVSQYYNDFVKSGRTVETFEMESPETGLYELKFEEPKGQDLGGATGIAPILLTASSELSDVSTRGWTQKSTTFNEYEEAVKNILMPLNGVTVDVSDSGVLTISVEGLGTAPTIQLDQKLETKKTVKNAIAEILKRVDSGQDLGGAVEPETPKPAENEGTSR